MKRDSLTRTTSGRGRHGVTARQQAIGDDHAARLVAAHHAAVPLQPDEVRQIGGRLRIPLEQVITLHGLFDADVRSLFQPLRNEHEDEALSDADLAQRFMALSLQACPDHDRYGCLQSWIRHARPQPGGASAELAMLPVQALTLAASRHDMEFKELVFRDVMPRLQTFSAAVQVRLLLCVAYADPEHRDDAIAGLRARGQLELAEQTAMRLNTPPARWSAQQVEQLLAQVEQTEHVGDAAHRHQLLLLGAAPVHGSQRDRLVACIATAFAQSDRSTPPGLAGNPARWSWVALLPPSLALDAFKRMPAWQQQRFLVDAPDNAVSAACRQHLLSPR